MNVPPKLESVPSLIMLPKLLNEPVLKMIVDVGPSVKTELFMVPPWRVSILPPTLLVNVLKLSIVSLLLMVPMLKSVPPLTTVMVP